MPNAPKSAVAIVASSVSPRIGNSYPDPYDKPCSARQKHPLGDVFGLSQYGVNLVKLPPGCWSSQRHWHSAEDEFVFVVKGCPTLVTDSGETELNPGMCAGFVAGVADGHHLVNKTHEEVEYLEVGTRDAEDNVEYSDIDMQVRRRGVDGVFTHKDGIPYE